jgi:hypothetical protein
MVVRPTRSPGQEWPQGRKKNGDLSVAFSVHGAGGSPTGSDPEIRVGDQDIGSSGRPVSSWLQVPGEPRHCRARTTLASAAFFPQNALHLQQQRWVILRVDSLALWKIINWGMPSWSQKIEARTFLSDFCTRSFWCWVSCYAAIPLIVALSPGHSDLTTFRPWSPIASDSNHLDRAEKIPNVAQTTDIVDDFDPRSAISGTTSRRASACPNLHEW